MSIKIVSGEALLTNGSAPDYTAPYTVAGWFRSKHVAVTVADGGTTFFDRAWANLDDVQVEVQDGLAQPDTLYQYDGKWHYLILYRHGNGVVRCFVDFTYMSSIFSNSSGRNEPSYYVRLDDYTGDQSDFAYWRAWEGELPDFQLLMVESQSATPVYTVGLWADWPLISDINDYSGNDRHLQCTEGFWAPVLDDPISPYKPVTIQDNFDRSDGPIGPFWRTKEGQEDFAMHVLDGQATVAPDKFSGEAIHVTPMLSYNGVVSAKFTGVNVGDTLRLRARYNPDGQGVTVTWVVGQSWELSSNFQDLIEEQWYGASDIAPGVHDVLLDIRDSNAMLYIDGLGVLSVFAAAPDIRYMALDVVTEDRTATIDDFTAAFEPPLREPGTVIQDTFNREDGDAGEMWLNRIPYSRPVILGGTLVPNTHSGSRAVYAVPLDSANFTLTATLYFAHPGGSVECYLRSSADINDENNVRFSILGSGHTRLRNTLGNEVTHDNMGEQFTGYVTLKIKLKGEDATVYLDDVQTLTLGGCTTDADTYVGIGVYGADVAFTYLDDFLVVTEPENPAEPISMYDNFNRPDGDVGLAWINPDTATRFMISNEHIVPQNVDGSLQGYGRYVQQFRTADLRLAATVYLGSSGSRVEWYFRCDENLEGGAEVSLVADQFFNIRNTQGELVETEDSAIIASGQTLNVVIEAIGPNITLYVDGVQILTIGGSTNGAGRNIALMLSSPNTEDTVYLDDFYAEDMGTPSSLATGLINWSALSVPMLSVTVEGFAV